MHTASTPTQRHGDRAGARVALEERADVELALAARYDELALTAIRLPEATYLDLAAEARKRADRASRDARALPA